MPAQPYIDLSLALSLSEACGEAYSQYDRGGNYTPPAGFLPLLGFRASSGGQPEWFGYVARSDDSVLVVFRGTVTQHDWVADAEFFQVDYPYYGGALKTHSGFTRTYSTCRDEIMKTVLDQSDTLSLIVTGHSLGASLATLFAMDADQATSFRKTVMYTFGGPRTGDRAFARAFDKQDRTAVRVVNIHDAIPRLPPSYIQMPETNTALRYQHVGKEYRLSLQTGSVKGNHEIATYTRALRTVGYERPPQKRITSRRRLG